MPDIATVKFAVPASSEEFERLATDIAGRIYRCRFQRNGRSGQSQHGIDAYAQRDGQLIGLQHKNVERMSRTFVEKTAAKAREFKPSLSEFVVMTSSPRDADIQLFIREMDARHFELKRFRVRVLFWEDISEELAGHKDLVAKFYPRMFDTDRGFGRDRADAWLQHVIVPWMDSLDAGIALLAVSDLSWRCISNRTEVLRPLHELVTSQRVGEDFSRAHQRLHEASQSCGVELRVTTFCAKYAHEEIANCDDFRQLVVDRLKQYRARADYERQLDALSIDALIALVAEHILNNVALLPSNRAEAGFWSEVGLELRVLSPSRRLRGLRWRMSALSNVYVRLREDLADLTFDCCERFGMAPLP